MLSSSPLPIGVIFGLYGCYPPIMENQLDKKMENDMPRVIYRGLGFRV